MKIKANVVQKKAIIEQKYNKRPAKDTKKVSSQTERASLVSQKFLDDIKMADVSQPERVNDIKQSLKDGTYQVNFNGIANALIK